MSLSEAREVVDQIIFGEQEAAVDGNAYLDPPQVEALKVASIVLGDVMHADVAKYLDEED